MTFGINGGIAQHDEILRELGDPRHPVADKTTETTTAPLDSVMVGRAVLNDSFFLRGVDESVFGIASNDGTSQETALSVDASVAEGEVFQNSDIEFRVRTLRRYAKYCDDIMDDAGPTFASRAFRWSLKPLIPAFNNVGCYVFLASNALVPLRMRALH